MIYYFTHNNCIIDTSNKLKPFCDSKYRKIISKTRFQSENSKDYSIRNPIFN